MSGLEDRFDRWVEEQLAVPHHRHGPILVAAFVLLGVALAVLS